MKASRTYKPCFKLYLVVTDYYQGNEPSEALQAEAFREKEGAEEKETCNL